MDLATLWAIFSQTLPVTLNRRDYTRRSDADFSDCEAKNYATAKKWREITDAIRMPQFGSWVRIPRGFKVFRTLNATMQQCNLICIAILCI
jgi:hypothetical protein